MIRFIRGKLKAILILLIILSAGFLLYQNYVRSTVKKTETAKVKRGDLEEKLTISGTIDADEKATLRFQTSGRLAWVGVKEGDYVKKYQAIASLDQREVKKDLEKDLQDYLTQRWNFDQQREDYNIKTQSPNDAGHLTVAQRRIMEKAQFTMNKSVLDVEIQNLSVEFSNLFTPIEGIVTKLNAAFAGMNVTPATSEFEVINPDSIFLSISAEQGDVVKLREGETGDLVLDSYPDKTLSGEINQISFTPKAGETGTVYAVKFKFNDNNSGYKYRVGMTGDVSFVTEKKGNVLYLPLKFVKSENGLPAGKAGKKYITVKTGEKMEKRYVTTGMETDSDIEITSGVQVGETVYQ